MNYTTKQFYIAAIILVVFLIFFFVYGKAPFINNSNTQPTPTIVEPSPTSMLTSPVATESASPTSSPSATISPMTFDKTKKYTGVLHTTEGDITIEFTASMTPKTVENFVTLARKNFYNNVIFHRVIKGFMIQGGDPTGTGSGGPGYKFDDEPFQGEYTRGTVAMANAGPNTNGSQFFIMHQDNPLPKNYVIFGKVTAGIDVVDKIATAPVTSSAMGEPSKPVNPVSIKSVDITEE